MLFNSINKQNKNYENCNVSNNSQKKRCQLRKGYRNTNLL